MERRSLFILLFVLGLFITIFYLDSAGDIQNINAFSTVNVNNAQNIVIPSPRLSEVEQALRTSSFYSQQIAEDPGADQAVNIYLNRLRTQNPLTSSYLVSVLQDFEREDFDERWVAVRIGLSHSIADLLSLGYPEDIRVYGTGMPLFEETLLMSNKIYQDSLFPDTYDDITGLVVSSGTNNLPWTSQLNAMNIPPDPYSYLGSDGYPDGALTNNGNFRNQLYPTQDPNNPQQIPNPYNIVGGDDPISDKTAYQEIANRFGGTCYAWATWACNKELGDPKYQGPKTHNKYIALSEEISGATQVIVTPQGSYLGPVSGADAQQEADYYHRKGYCVLRVYVNLDNAGPIISSIKNAQQQHPGQYDSFLSWYGVGGHIEHIEGAESITEITQDCIAARRNNLCYLPSSVDSDYMAPLTGSDDRHTGDYYDAIRNGDIRVFRAKIKTLSWLRDGYAELIILTDRNGNIIRRVHNTDRKNDAVESAFAATQGAFEDMIVLRARGKSGDPHSGYGAYITIVYPCPPATTSGNSQLPPAISLPQGTEVELYNGVTKKFERKVVGANGELNPPSATTPPTPPAPANACTKVKKLCLDKCPQSKYCNAACTECIAPPPKPPKNPVAGGKTPD